MTTFERRVVLIDKVNMYLTTQEIFKEGVIDWRELFTHFPVIWRKIFYCVLNPGHSLDGFEAYAGHLNAEVKVIPVKVFKDGNRKGDADMQIAMDAISLAKKVDTVCICSNDSDFIPVFEFLKHEGVRTELVCHREKAGKNLIDACDHFIPVTKHMLRKKSA